MVFSPADYNLSQEIVRYIGVARRRTSKFKNTMALGHFSSAFLFISAAGTKPNASFDQTKFQP